MKFGRKGFRRRRKKITRASHCGNQEEMKFRRKEC